MSMLFSSTILYEIEKGIREDGTNPFSSIPATFYWSIVTVTTVGYGDIYPITDAGKIFTSFYVLTGIGIIFAFIRASTSRRIRSRK